MTELEQARADAEVMREQAQRHLAEIGRLREALRLARDGWKGLLESDYANRDNPDPWARRVESAVIDRALSSTAPAPLATARESGVRAGLEAAEKHLAASAAGFGEVAARARAASRELAALGAPTDESAAQAAEALDKIACRFADEIAALATDPARVAEIAKGVKP